MIKNTLQILFFLTILLPEYYAQSSEFKKGYIISESGEKTTCFIKDEDWTTNPEQFEYKLSKESSDVRTGKLSDIKLFAVEDEFKYEKVTVKMDKDLVATKIGEEYAQLNYKEQTLYLNKIVEGKVNLYFYQQDRLEIFFINEEGSDVIEQLEHKTYYEEKFRKNSERNNNNYRKQLYDTFDSRAFDRDKLKSVEYDLNDMLDLFIDYNVGSDNFRVNYVKNKIRINVYAKIGVNSSSLLVQGNLFKAKFPNDINFRIAGEFEVVMPFSKGKWSVFVSPGYQTYSNDGENVNLPEDLPDEAFEMETSIDYSSLEIPIGFRRYFTFGDSDIKLYASAAYVFDITINDDIFINDIEQEVVPDAGFNYMLGAGVRYNDLGLEFLYFTDRDLLSESNSFSSNYQNIALNLTYKFL